MKGLLVQAVYGIRKVFLAFLPSIITVGIIIFVVYYFNLWPSSATQVQISGQQSTTPPNSIDAVNQVSQRAIETANNTVEMMRWVIATFLGLAISGAALFWRTEKEIAQKITQIQRDYDLVSETLVKAESQLSDLYLKMQQDLYDLPSQILPYEVAIAAYQAGKITENQLFESQAWFSWQKWIFADDPTGYQELTIHKESREGLPVSIVRAAITVLTKLIEKKKRPGAFNTHDQDEMTKLLKLLNLETQN